MESSTTTELLIIQPKTYKYRNEYKVDMWVEVRRRWLVGGVMLAVLLAVITPRLGASGGLLHTEYLGYAPLWYIYYASGRRARRGGVTRLRSLGRLPLLCALHAHVVAPALCVVVVDAFRDGIDHRVVKGAIFSSVGGPCAWLSLAVSGSARAAPLVATSYLASLLAVPLSMIILCGRAMVPPLGNILATSLSSLAPFLLGAARRPDVTSHETTTTKLSALLLLYAECCTRLRDAEGSLNVGDVLVTLLLVLCYVVSSACVCVLYARVRLVRVGEGRLLMVCAVPKCLDVGWITSAACAPDGMARLPASFLCVAHALLLAAAAPSRDVTADSDVTADARAGLPQYEVER